MRKVKLYIAMSLNGKIAKSDGSVDWLEAIPNPDKSDYGYMDFYQSVDTTIQGYSTYAQIINWEIDFPYADKKNYVITRQEGLGNTEFVTFINENQSDFIRDLKQQKGSDIWLIGGGQINTLLLNEQLIDEILVFIMPIILSDGIELFEALPKETNLKLLETKIYNSGVVELRYSLFE
ncbi:MAG: dihydrofolate reductase [Saprospiraceae bacterium]|nr:dihydrofolate reductase [Saprospiraceae bacterium]